MAIITISRGSFSHGKEVAEALAKRLGYECVSRDILLETCDEFSIPEIRLVKGLHDAPSILERFNQGRERYISYFRATFLDHMAKDNIVYHGLSGHFFLQEVTHALKVRIIANMEDRIKEEMKRENSSAEEARHLLEKDDEERRRWGLSLHGKDPWNCSLYDLVLSIDIMTTEDVVNIIEEVVKQGRFIATPESTAKLKEQAMLAGIHAQVVSFGPQATVVIKNGIVTLDNLDDGLEQDEDLRQKTAQKLIKTYNVKDVVFAQSVTAKKDHINPFYKLD